MREMIFIIIIAIATIEAMEMKSIMINIIW